MATGNANVAMLPPELISPGMSPAQIVAILRAHRRWIAAVTVATAAVVTVVSLLMPKTYESTATLLIDYEVNDPLSGREFSPMLAGGYLSTQVDFIQSAPVLIKAMDQLGFSSNPEWLAGYNGTGGEGGKRTFLLEKMRKSLDVSTFRDSRLVYVTFAADSAELSAQAANTIARLYLESHGERSSGPSRESARRYTEQLAELSAKVDAAQAKVTEFRRSSGLIDLDQKVDVEGERLRDLSSRLTQAEADRRSAELRLQQLGRARSGGASSDFAMLDSSLIQSLKTQLVGLEARMADLSKVIGRNHPERIALAAEIDSVRGRLNAELSLYVAAIQGQARVAADNEAQLRKELEEQRTRVLEMRGLADDGARFQREFDSAKRLYDQTLNGYDQVLRSSEGNYSNASFLAEAQPPATHSKPKTRINLLLGLFGGLFLGIASSVLRELLNRRVRCREDLERDLGVPVLAELGEPQGLLST